MNNSFYVGLECRRNGWTQGTTTKKKHRKDGKEKGILKVCLKILWRGQ